MKAKEIRPFIASKDFEISKSFYKDLGFEITYDSSDLVIMSMDETSFFLQAYYTKEWAENTMVQLTVDDLDGLYNIAVKLIDKYPGTKIKAIFKADYGRTFHLIDPAGVLWHMME